MASAKSDSKHAPVLRHTVTLNFALAGDGTGDEKGCLRTIDIPFDVTEMVVRQVTSFCSAFPPAIDIPVLVCDTFGQDGMICSIAGQLNAIVSTPLNTVFQVPPRIKGAHRFRIRDATDADAPYSSIHGAVAVTLEFRGKQ